MNRKRIILAAAILIPLTLVGTASAGLVAAYSFDDDTATDVSGGGNDGTLGATTAFSDDNPFGAGRSVIFDATANSVIDVPSSPALAGVDNAMTVAFWMKASNAQGDWGRQVQKRSGGDGWDVNRHFGNNAVNLRVDTSAGVNQNVFGTGIIPNVYDNTWHHIAFTMDNGTLFAYLDGAQVGTEVYNHGNGFGNNGPMTIGGDDNAYGNILMDDLGVWDEALDANAIAELANGPIVNPIPEPSTLILLMMGILGCGLRRFARRRKRA
ncbi:MAG: PEP-CTERM sorting domain-containing protein [Planctomycetes bacterium]|nr:PEP-CTERM sorting domain-containing protein [Planctomycetota bacterium]